MGKKMNVADAAAISFVKAARRFMEAYGQESYWLSFGLSVRAVLEAASTGSRRECLDAATELRGYAEAVASEAAMLAGLTKEEP